MSKDEWQPSPLTIVATLLFMAVLIVVFIAFEPTRNLLCERYRPQGLSGVIETWLGSGGTCSQDFFYDYQTLVTGVLAVLAAGVTVAVMIRTDQRAQQRHEQLIDLTVGADTLRLERLLRIWGGELSKLSEDADLAVKEAEEYRDNPSKGIYDPEAPGSVPARISRIISDPVFQQTSDLFSAELTLAIVSMNEPLRTISGASMSMKRWARFEQDGQEKEPISAICESLVQLRNCLQKVNLELSQMAVTYKLLSPPKVGEVELKTVGH